MPTVKIQKTKENIERIRELRLTNTNQEIADMYGVSANTIIYIAHRFNLGRRPHPYANGKKKCSRCDEIKPMDSFRRYLNKRGKYTYRHQCLPCERKSRVEWYYKYQKQNQKRAIVAYGKEDNLMRMLKGAIHRSKIKGENCSLTLDYLKSIWTGRCQLSGLPFSDLQNGRQHPFRPSIDRIDNSKGYTNDNVRIILWALNLAINRYDFDVYLTIAKAVLSKVNESKAA